MLLALAQQGQQAQAAFEPLSSEEAARLFVLVGIAIFFLNPLSGLLMDAFKVFLLLGFASLAIQILPFDQIDNWSRDGVDQFNIGPDFVPLICVVGLIGLSTANLLFVSGTNFERILKALLYVVGGVFAAGSPEWIEFERATGGVIAAILTVIVTFIRLFVPILPQLKI